MSDNAFTAWDIAIGLNIPAPHDKPLFFLHERNDFLKQFVIVLFHPLVNKAFIMIEYQSVVFFA